MPLYDYACGHCGPFRAWESMSRCREPADCPACGGPAPRRVTAPYLGDMNPHERIAHYRNEKSADQPEVMTRTELDHAGRKRSAHAHGHGHGGHHHHHHHGRPWMMGH